MKDWELIQRYLETADDDAFGEIVRRHVALVYASARRQVGPDLANDVTQAVFLLLTRKAPSLRRDVVLSSWLYRATGFVAAQARRREARRVRREKEAGPMISASESPDPEDDLRSRVEPFLDEAVAALPEVERRFLACRFFERLRFSEVATRFGVTEDAAKKRVSRALDRLRLQLAQRGVALSSTVLGGLLSPPKADALPAGLAQAARNLSRTRLGGACSTRVKELADAAELALGRVPSLSVARGSSSASWSLPASIVGVVCVLTLGWIFMKRSPSGDTVPSADPGLDARQSLVDAMRARRDAHRHDLEAGYRLEVTVVDAVAGRGVEGARIEERRSTGAGWNIQTVHQSDPQGLCPITVSSRDFESLVLLISSPGRTPVTLTWQGYEFDRPLLRYTCRLYPGRQRSGLVRNARTDEPIAEATVHIHGPASYASGSREGTRFEVTLETDATGRFTTDQIPEFMTAKWDARFGRMQPGQATQVRVSHPDFSTGYWTFAAESEWPADLKFFLDAGVTLRGIVSDDRDQPVAGAQVLAVGRGRIGYRTPRIVTDSFGHFEAPHFPSPIAPSGIDMGIHAQPDFSVDAPGFAPYHGVVLSKDSPFPPLPRIPYLGRREGAASSIDEGEFFDARGRRRWPGSPTTYHRLIRPPGPGETDSESIWVDVSLSAAVSGNHPDLIVNDVPPPRPIRLVGRVVEAQSGTPIPAFRLLAYHAGSTDRHLIGEGVAGAFDWEVGTAWQPSMLLEVASEGHGTAGPTTMEEEGDVVRVLFQLGTSVEIEGWVELPNARPAKGALVAMGGDGTRFTLSASETFEIQGDSAHWSSTATDGSFRVRRSMRADALQILHPEGCALFPINSSMANVIRLEPWAEVQGTVLGQGAPVAQAEVRMRSRAATYGENAEGYAFSLSTQTDDRGRFRFPRVPPGWHQLETEGAQGSVVVERGRAAPVELRVN